MWEKRLTEFFQLQPHKRDTLDCICRMMKMFDICDREAGKTGIENWEKNLPLWSAEKMSGFWWSFSWILNSTLCSRLDSVCRLKFHSSDYRISLRFSWDQKGKKERKAIWAHSERAHARGNKKSFLWFLLLGLAWLVHVQFQMQTNSLSNSFHARTQPTTRT